MLHIDKLQAQLPTLTPGRAYANRRKGHRARDRDVELERWCLTTTVDSFRALCARPGAMLANYT
eukprot:m.457706 g.457706  ORF g.457706 m.457706 type:complete len:64 (+) comp21330_c0_seq1:776-967(+)